MTKMIGTTLIMTHPIASQGEFSIKNSLEMFCRTRRELSVRDVLSSESLLVSGTEALAFYSEHMSKIDIKSAGLASGNAMQSRSGVSLFKTAG